MRLQIVTARLSLLLVLAVAANACATVESPQEEVVVTTQPAAVVTSEGAVVAVPTDLVTVHPTFVTTWRGTDPAALRVYFSDDATVITPTRTYTGWEEINTAWLTPLLPGITAHTLTPGAFTTEGADVIVETGNYSYRITTEATPRDVSGTYTHRWQRQPDGTWRLVSVRLN